MVVGLSCESAVLAALWLGLVIVGIGRFPDLTMLLTGPLLAAVLFIYARLLGRLAWRAANNS